MADQLVDKLADHVERFECTVYGDGRLVLFTEPPLWGNRERGKHVGQARKVGDMDWRIEHLEVRVPDYLKPLLGKSFDGMNLRNALCSLAIACGSRALRFSSATTLTQGERRCPNTQNDSI